MAVYCHMSSCLFVILVPDLTVKLVLRPKDDPPLLGRNYKLECKHTLGPYASLNLPMSGSKFSVMMTNK